MLDKKRIAVKFDELAQILAELEQITPKIYKQYLAIEKRRSCERLMQLSIECVLDVCKLIVSGLNLGMPGKEIDIPDVLEKSKVISKKLNNELKEMRGFRNILVHEYAAIDNELAFKILKTKINSFAGFKKEITEFIKSK